MLERLWSGWRSSYVCSLGGPDGHSDGPSVFSLILASGLSDEETHIVHRGRTCFAILNAYPYATAHTLVLPYREVGDLEDLSTEEFEELWATARDAVTTIKSTYR